jgi:hypothetical protein
MTTRGKNNRENIKSDIGYHIKFLVGTLIRSYYGCGRPFRRPPHAPPPPYDIVICQKEYRTYTNIERQLKLTLQPQNVHYHCRWQCITALHRSYLVANFIMYYQYWESQLYIVLILYQSLSCITSIENHSFISF